MEIIDHSRIARSRLTGRRTALVLAALAGLLLLAAAAAVVLGSERVAAAEIWAGVWAHLTGAASPLGREQEVIIFGLRLPRVALAAGVGAALAMAGAAFQALLRNPLADPYILGVSSGAALGSILGLDVRRPDPAQPAAVRVCRRSGGNDSSSTCSGGARTTRRGWSSPGSS